MSIISTCVHHFLISSVWKQQQEISDFTSPPPPAQKLSVVTKIFDIEILKICHFRFTENCYTYISLLPLSQSNLCSFFFRKFIMKFCSMHQCFTELFFNKPRVISTKLFFSKRVQICSKHLKTTFLKRLRSGHSN